MDVWDDVLNSDVLGVNPLEYEIIVAERDDRELQDALRQPEEGVASDVLLYDNTQYFGRNRGSIEFGRGGRRLAGIISGPYIVTQSSAFMSGRNHMWAVESNHFYYQLKARDPPGICSVRDSFLAGDALPSHAPDWCREHRLSFEGDGVAFEGRGFDYVVRPLNSSVKPKDYLLKKASLGFGPFAQFQGNVRLTSGLIGNHTDFDYISSSIDEDLQNYIINNSEWVFDDSKSGFNVKLGEHPREDFFGKDVYEDGLKYSR